MIMDTDFTKGSVPHASLSRRILNFIRREAVLCCAALAALASTLFVPPFRGVYFPISTSACCACFSA